MKATSLLSGTPKKVENGRRDEPMAVHHHNNERIAFLFRATADLLAAQRANPYRVRAYRKAADSLLSLSEDVADCAKEDRLEEIEGIGRELAEKVREFLETGTIRSYEELKTPLPEEVRNWSRLPGLSDSLVTYLYVRLGIRSLDDLERLVRSHLLKTLPGFTGSEEALLRAIAALRTRSG